MTIAQCLFLASLHRRRHAVLSSFAEIAPLPCRLLLDFFGIPHISEFKNMRDGIWRPSLRSLTLRREGS